MKSEPSCRPRIFLQQPDLRDLCATAIAAGGNFTMKLQAEFAVRGGGRRNIEFQRRGRNRPVQERMNFEPVVGRHPDLRHEVVPVGGINHPDPVARSRIETGIVEAQRRAVQRGGPVEPAIPIGVFPVEAGFLDQLEIVRW